MKYIFLILAMVSQVAHSFQCGRENSLEHNFKKSGRVFLIYVTQVTLDKKSTKEMNKEYPDSAGFVKILRVKYDTVENFKGDKRYNPNLRDLLGIGTGYIGFIPGTYYLVTLPEPEKNEPNNYRYVSFCDVHFQHYRNDVEEYKQIIEQAKKLASDKNS